LKIDRESSTDLWQKAIEKVMSQIKVAFNILDEGAIE
jgi:ribosomal protein L31E